MWVVVDANLASFTELEKEWTLGDYLEAVEYLAAKAQKTAEAQDQAKRQGQTSRR